MKQKLRSRFRLLTLLQVILLSATIAGLIVSIIYTATIAVPIVLAGIVIAQIVILVQSVQRHVDALEDFFAAVNYEDFTRRFIEDDVDAELKDAFNKVLERFQDARADRDLQAGYLDTVIRHVPVPFIAARSDGSLSLINNPARRLTGLPTMRNIGDLAAIDPNLPDQLAAIEAGQQRLLQTSIRDIPVELRVSVSEIRMQGEVERLYSIENLSGELSARESSAWRNLIRVLTHEIMNTLTPVTSLAHTTVEMLDDPEATDDIREAIATIGRRSDGMIRFVSRYRELLQVPEPNAETIRVRELLQGVATLMQTDMGSTAISVAIDPESLEIFADRQLIEQVLINLVRNAADALGESDAGEIRLEAKLDPGRTIITVADNGPGIPESDLDQVFIPFFTTKRDGSGIGLSLSRQIMSAHGGELVVDSSSDGTTARLVFD
ncbi:MAG: ATP-binding protein [Woeseiaceae bacterium]|nr:ATP-binding protein [Woeseiaceae bacterium]